MGRGNSKALGERALAAARRHKRTQQPVKCVSLAMPQRCQPSAERALPRRRGRRARWPRGRRLLLSGLLPRRAYRGSIDGLPSYVQALKDHGALADSLESLQERVERNETQRLY